jgi:[ribosomal protein S5]-alanine N-acetyltransferase
MKILETERLLLRPFTDDDTEVHRVVFSDLEVCRYYCGKTRTEEETREWLIHRRWQTRNEDELGFLAVIRKADERIIGLFALQVLAANWLVLEGEENSPYAPLIVELSYALGRDYWRQGYGTEAGQALIDFAFLEMRLPRLVNGIDEANTPSIRLAEKLGFRRVKNRHPEHGGFAWVLDNTLL